MIVLGILIFLIIVVVAKGAEGERQPLLQRIRAFTKSAKPPVIKRAHHSFTPTITLQATRQQQNPIPEVALLRIFFSFSFSFFKKKERGGERRKEAQGGTTQPCMAQPAEITQASNHLRTLIRQFYIPYHSGLDF